MKLIQTTTHHHHHHPHPHKGNPIDGGPPFFFFISPLISWTTGTSEFQFVCFLGGEPSFGENRQNESERVGTTRVCLKPRNFGSCLALSGTKCPDSDGRGFVEGVFHWGGLCRSGFLAHCTANRHSTVHGGGLQSEGVRESPTYSKFFQFCQCAIVGFLFSITHLQACIHATPHLVTSRTLHRPQSPPSRWGRHHPMDYYMRAANKKSPDR